MLIARFTMYILLELITIMISTTRATRLKC